MAKPNHAIAIQPHDEKGSPAVWGTSEELLLAYAVNRYGTNSWDSISSELRKRSSSAAKLFTPEHCKQKYLQLERRFNRSIGDDDTTATATVTAAAVPWIEQLRSLRVEELQRKLQKIDIYISSLQLKVKKLSEESTENGYGGRNKNPDLGQKIDDIEIKNEEEVNRNTVKSDEKHVSGGDESESDDQSVNGSNGNLETGEKSDNESSPVYTPEEKPESSPIGVEEWFDGRPDAKEPVKSEPDRGEPESIAKENSDVQSSASKSRKERSDRVRRGNSKVDEPEDEDQPNDNIPVTSLPLIDVLKKVHKLGSAVFERRLDRQEKARYKKLIREHIDFEILQTRLKQGWYSDGNNNNLFRDLLLVVNNTLIFFSHESPQSIAAIQLRQFILNQMTSTTIQKTDSKSKPTTFPPKRAPESSDYMLLKPKLAGSSMAVCRKRSSIAAKSSNKKESETKRINDGFPPILKKTRKNIDGGSDDLESRSLGSENSDVKSDAKRMKDKMEEKRPSSSAAANNLAARGGSEDDCGGGGGEQKRGGEGKKDEAVKRRSGGRQLDSPGKKNVGRPPKKAAAPPPPAVAGLRKRNRECAEGEPSVSKQAKKRSKRLY